MTLQFIHIQVQYLDRCLREATDLTEAMIVQARLDLAMAYYARIATELVLSKGYGF